VVNRAVGGAVAAATQAGHVLSCSVYLGGGPFCRMSSRFSGAPSSWLGVPGPLADPPGDERSQPTLLFSTGACLPPVVRRLFLAAAKYALGGLVAQSGLRTARQHLPRHGRGRRWFIRPYLARLTAQRVVSS